MIHLDLFAIGCGIFFIFLAGTYAFLRERFLEGTRREKARIDQERHAPVPR